MCMKKQNAVSEVGWEKKGRGMVKSGWSGGFSPKCYYFGLDFELNLPLDDAAKGKFLGYKIPSITKINQ